eukprot:SAG25_NODE_11444_length_304_cov_0.760976_1_plen_68_part_10
MCVYRLTRSTHLDFVRWQDDPLEGMLPRPECRHARIEVMRVERQVVRHTRRHVVSVLRFGGHSRVRGL